MELSAKIKFLRKQQKMTQEELARKISVERSSVGKYETGTMPSMDVLSRIASCFDVSIDYLVDNSQITPTLRNHTTVKKSSLKGITLPEPDLSKRELELIQKYRNNPQMQPAVNTLLGITAEDPEDAYEIPVAARSGKIGKATSSHSEEERRAALESEFPGVFEEKE